MPVKSALALDAKKSIRDLTGGSHSSMNASMKVSINIYNHIPKKTRILPRLVFIVSYGDLTFTGKDMSFNLKAGKTAQLNVVGKDIDGVERQISDILFSSSNEAAVIVDQAGVLTWVAEGGAIITATAKSVPSGNSLVATLEVFAEVAPVIVELEAVTLELTAVEIA